MLTEIFTIVSLSTPETLGCLHTLLTNLSKLWSCGGGFYDLMCIVAHRRDIHLQLSSVYVCSCALKCTKTFPGQQPSNCAVYSGDSFSPHLRIVFNWIGFVTFITELVKCPLSWELVLFIETHHLKTTSSLSTVLQSPYFWLSHIEHITKTEIMAILKYSNKKRNSNLTSKHLMDNFYLLSVMGIIKTHMVNLCSLSRFKFNFE